MQSVDVKKPVRASLLAHAYSKTAKALDGGNALAPAQHILTGTMTSDANRRGNH